MKRILKTALTCTLLLNLGLASVAMASPGNTDQFAAEKFTEIQTSGTAKAKVGKYQGDNTIIMDEKGNKFTLGELKAQTNVILPESPDQIIEIPGTNVPPAPHNDMATPFASAAYGNAWAYSAVNSSSINCYGYSLRVPWAWNPGDGDSVSNVYDTRYFTDPDVGAALIIKDGTSNQLYLKSGWKKLSVESKIAKGYSSQFYTPHGMFVRADEQNIFKESEIARTIDEIGPNTNQLIFEGEFF